MFRMIFRRVRAGRFLDLCSGCGTVGLEAISVGSMLSTFVERSARVSSMLRKNLADLGVKDGHSEVVEMEAAPFLMRVGKRKRLWDVIFLGDVAESDRDELLDLLGRGRVIKPGGIAVIEHSSENPLPDTIGLLRRWRTINDENVSLSFYNRKP
jgi:16S rRNA (guanine(966)-N(2))-methyltransferase RsmD